MRLNAVRVKPLRDWTLRARLVASMLGLLAVLCIAIGAVTEVALHHFLMGRLDDQLNQAGGRFNHAVENPPPRTSGGPGSSDFLPRGQAPGTIGAHVSATGTLS